MQPDTGGGFDWAHAATGLGGGALGTFLTWVWRVARIEPKIELKISEAEKRLETEIEEAERRAETKVEEMTGHFHEAFAGIRRQMDDIGKDSLPREEFNTFRKEAREDAETSRRENREDFAALHKKIDAVLARHK